MSRFKRRKVRKVVQECFWEGFWQYLHGGIGCDRPSLEYVSDSDYAAYNGIRKIALQAGIDECKRILAERDGKRFSGYGQPKIPGSLWAEAFGEAESI